jgi:hypothetical protein
VKEGGFNKERKGRKEAKKERRFEQSSSEWMKQGAMKGMVLISNEEKIGATKEWTNEAMNEGRTKEARSNEELRI